MCAKVFLFMWRRKGKSRADERRARNLTRVLVDGEQKLHRSYGEGGPLSDYSAIRMYNKTGCNLNQSTPLQTILAHSKNVTNKTYYFHV